MPRYHFNITDGAPQPDVDGSLLDGIAQCRIEAVRLFGQILSDRPDELWAEHEMTIEVTDQAGMILFILQLTALESPALKGNALHV